MCEIKLHRKRWLQVTLYLCIYLFAALVTGLSGQSVCHTRWDTTWYNDSHPMKEDDKEFLPNGTVLDDFCDPQQGSIVIRCSPDPDQYFWFHGYYETEDYSVECNSTFGLECYMFGDDQLPGSQASSEYPRASYACPDHALQLGCETCQASVPSPCSTGTSGQHQNTGSQPSVAHGLVVLGLLILFLV